MASINLARILLVLPFAAVIACGNGGSTGAAGTGGETSTASGATSTASAGTGGMMGSATASTTGATGGAMSGSTTSSTSSTSATASSTSGTGGGTPGACTDAADKMANMTTVGNDASGCVTSNCIVQYLASNWSGLTTCVASCLQTKDTLTTGCAACWGAVVSCGAQHCASQCANGTSPACTTCTDQFCTPAFNTCAGM